MEHGASAGLLELEQYLPVAAEDVAADDADVLVIRGMLEVHAGQTTAALADTRRVLAIAGQGSTPIQIARAHFQLATVLVTRGEWDEAAINASTGASLNFTSHITSTRYQCLAVLATIHAHRGAIDACLPLLEEIESAVETAGLESKIMARIAAASLARVQQESTKVIDLLIDVPAIAPMMAALAFWPLLIEALIADGRLEEAAQQIEQLDRAARLRGLNLTARLAGLKGDSPWGEENARRRFSTSMKLLVRGALMTPSSTTLCFSRARASS